MTIDILNDTFPLGQRTLRNRVLLAPMTRVSAETDGTVSQRIVDYYRVFAHGGFGALITESVYIDQTYSAGYFNQPGLVTPEHVASWSTVADAVHAEGALLIAQLMHAGPQSQEGVFGHGALGPSTERAPGNQLAMYGQSGPYPKPDHATAEHLEDVVQSFARAAVNAREAGFDGVEIHGANGYLLDAFLTDYLNTREDGYGGSPEGRVRLTLEVAEAVREAVGHDFIVGVRISQAKVSDPHHKWSGGPSEAEAIFRALSSVNLDFIHTSEHYATAPAFDGDPRTLAAFAKQFGGTVVIANGHLDTPAVASGIVESGDADLVAIGKSALSNRDWVKRGQTDQDIAEPFVVTNFGEIATVKDWELDRASAHVGQD